MPSRAKITDRFSTAVEHLGSDQLPVRLGGIYALWRLFKDSPERDVISVIDILCAFVRHPPHEIGQGPDPGASEDGQAAAEKADEARPTNKIRPDVQTVLDRIGTEKAVYRALLPDGYRLDLTGANLSDANLSDANLTRALLWNADLTGANLTGANLRDAKLPHANLTGAHLEDAKLPHANLTGAHLTRANLRDASLMGANFAEANLTGADLQRADLTGANLKGADLTGANLTGANLTHANLRDVELSDTAFWGATNLTQDQLDSACISKGGKLPGLPEGLKPPQNERVL